MFFIVLNVWAQNECSSHMSEVGGNDTKRKKEIACVRATDDNLNSNIKNNSSAVVRKRETPKTLEAWLVDSRHSLRRI